MTPGTPGMGQQRPQARARPAALMALCLLAAAFPCRGAEMILGGTSSFSLSCMVDPLSPLASTLEGALGLSPTLRVEDPLWRLELSSAFRWAGGGRGVTPALDRLSLALAPADFLTVRLGRFAYLPGAAGVFSVTNWFVGLDLVSLLTGGAAEAIRAGDMVQIGVTWRDITLQLTACPFPPEGSLLDADSPWLPMRGLPQTLLVPFPSPPTETHLAAIVVESPDAGPASLEGVSAGAELGATFSLLDLSLLAYHGRDNTALYRPRFSFPDGIWRDYRIILTPVERTIDAAGLSAAVAWRSLRGWVDCAYTFSKTYLSKRLSIDTFESDLARSPSLEYAAGASWELGAPHLSLQAGYRGEWIVNRAADTLAPLLASRIDARLGLGAWDGRITLSAQGICSTVDWSFVVVGALSFSPSNEFSLDLNVPVFLGGEDTELGQFSGNHIVSVRATARF